MIFSKKKIIIAYTIEKCSKCDMLKKRKFMEGDCLFSESSKCNSCDGSSIIEKIYGEELES